MNQKCFFLPGVCCKLDIYKYLRCVWTRKHLWNWRNPCWGQWFCLMCGWLAYFLNSFKYPSCSIISPELTGLWWTGLASTCQQQQVKLLTTNRSGRGTGSMPENWCGKREARLVGGQFSSSSWVMAQIETDSVEFVSGCSETSSGWQCEPACGNTARTLCWAYKLVIVQPKIQFTEFSPEPEYSKSSETWLDLTLHQITLTQSLLYLCLGSSRDFNVWDLNQNISAMAQTHRPAHGGVYSDDQKT